ncbi:heavy metal transporter [Maritimibacter sp. 55A14]|uniref:heavy-metal-associated domain-containing protein n=1 Tax=Maritimibacter sp. 55A14 TaxID=2174844 RepID=UPI000D619DAD|nr:heavy metal-associated domain-containing protein [Maritimibacter sp. 55A14]PWE29843.1 heavy metal transporter [Maritimibacter sp. 55A14]
MKRPLVITAAAALLSIGAALAMTPVAQASAQSATGAAETAAQTFAIENMTCAMCPITVRKAMEGVEGVRSVQVDFEAKTATVVFDPSATSAAAIAAASTNAGYPAKPES